MSIQRKSPKSPKSPGSTRHLLVAGLITLGILPVGVAWANPPAQSCDQIRARIKAHTGLPDRPNTPLLAQVGENRQCRFTAEEAYRAAWGDKPMPKDSPGQKRARHREDD